MTRPIISLRDLTKQFGAFRATDAISFDVHQGEIFGFLGANGAGKTTTIRMLCGLTRPTAGHGSIDGLDIWKQRAAIRNRLGYVPQRFSLYPDLTVLENLRFFAQAYRVPPERLRERLPEVLEQMDLGEKENARAGTLSGGFRQLLAIGCALIHEPALLFLDEPTRGLDPAHRQFIWDLIYGLSLEGTTIFVTTHYMDEVERCTDIGFIHRGRLLAKAPPAALKKSLNLSILQLKVEPSLVALERLRTISGIRSVDLRSGCIRIRSEHASELLKSWKNQWPFPDLQWRGHEWVEPDMEDVFMTLVEQGSLDPSSNQEDTR
jgi:ABC-2 type transport system ATP-binding protein